MEKRCAVNALIEHFGIFGPARYLGYSLSMAMGPHLCTDIANEGVDSPHNALHLQIMQYLTMARKLLMNV